MELPNTNSTKWENRKNIHLPLNSGYGNAFIYKEYIFPIIHITPFLETEIKYVGTRDIQLTNHSIKRLFSFAKGCLYFLQSFVILLCWLFQLVESILLETMCHKHPQNNRSTLHCHNICRNTKQVIMGI